MSVKNEGTALWIFFLKHLASFYNYRDFEQYPFCFSKLNLSLKKVGVNDAPSPYLFLSVRPNSVCNFFPRQIQIRKTQRILFKITTVVETRMMFHEKNLQGCTFIIP
jgi:hypothetical protein